MKHQTLLTAIVAFSLLSIFLTSAAQNPTTQPETYQVLKINLHAHTTYSDGTYTPTQLVNLYKDQGYDVLAITDHSTTDGYEEAYTEGTRIGLIVIGGEEVTCTWPDGTPKHVIALFTNHSVKIPENSNTETQAIFDSIHSQNGLSIIAHPWSAWSNWQNYRNEPYIDGWEVDYSMAWTLESGSIYILNHDFHNETWIQGIQSYWTYLLAENKTQAGVKDALMERRIIIYGNGTLYGSTYALNLYAQNQESLKTPSPSPTTTSPTPNPTITPTPTPKTTPTATPKQPLNSTTTPSPIFPTSADTPTTTPTLINLLQEASYTIAALTIIAIAATTTVLIKTKKKEKSKQPPYKSLLILNSNYTNNNIFINDTQNCRDIFL